MFASRETVAAASSRHLGEDNDDDEQSKLIHEQLKRNSLGLARDSLELLRNAPLWHEIGSEPSNDMDLTLVKRKSVLKSRSDSADNILTPELVSYIAIDGIEGDKNLVEKHMK